MKRFTDQVKKFVDSDVRRWASTHENIRHYPEELINTMKSLGLFGLNVPSEFGGFTATPKELLDIVRELARGFVPLTGMLGSHLKVCEYLVRFGTASQRENLLPKMANGSMIAAHAYTEKEGKSPDSLQTNLQLLSDKLMLQGNKILITNAANADLIAIVASYQTRNDEQDRKVGIALLSSKQDGLVISDDIPRLGMEGISLCNLNFECEITTEQMLGGIEFNGKKALEEVQIGTLINYSARAVGLAETIVKETIEYVESKKSVGHLLKDISAVQNKIASMKSRLKEEENILNELVSRFEEGTNLIKDAYKTKAFTTESTVDIARIGLALHGGVGYTKQHQIERHLREAIGLTLIGAPTDVALARAEIL
ncbi:hypothetical protein COT82_01715 [Candidatus Campbellbacteria bacterium CG10_big_fil_rev_8_21_14_0_10_35_52]|uniref:Acyl-CoA dehydrogenase n=1 Tax=Candidatus Campbellbacteria bacterium CG10_big_fil_rev_8_21_14_0_10_35_52 TaxID=1974527 RepID=A0A2M6WV79_9BACT|nr:MAG: hypothetical protein COT82_01715 [Candidatus Campbellbacteria bacterium CG10_big_fil_rev_8_21_14_0_10_35_52]